MYCSACDKECHTLLWYMTFLKIKKENFISCGNINLKKFRLSSYYSAMKILRVVILWDAGMNKIILSLLLAAAVLSMPGADLTAETGKVYKNMEVMRCVAGCVQIRHDDGLANLDWESLPDEFIAALPAKMREELQAFADLTLANGKVLRKAVIVSLGEGYVIFLHLGGRTRVPEKALPKRFLTSMTRKQLEEMRRKKSDDKPIALEITPDGKKVYRGKRGGRYYIENGRKIYLPKYREAELKKLPASTAGNRKDNH